MSRARDMYEDLAEIIVGFIEKGENGGPDTAEDISCILGISPNVFRAFAMDLIESGQVKISGITVEPIGPVVRVVHHYATVGE